MKNRLVRTVLTGFVISLLGVSVLADGSPELVAVKGSDEGAYCYFSGDTITSADIQIGGSICEITSVPTTIRTAIVIDSSIETYQLLEAHRTLDQSELDAEDASFTTAIEGDTIIPFANTFIDSHAENEIFSIYSLGQTCSMVTDWTTDYEVVKQSIAGFSFSAAPTAIISGIYDVISSVPDDGIYTRIVLITDGKDDDLYARTYEELAYLERSKQVPIYVIGIETGDAEATGRLNSYSRLCSRGSYFATGDGYNMSEFVGVLNADNSLQTFLAVPGNDMFIGSDFGVLCNLTTDSGSYEVEGSVRLPVLSVTPSPTPSLTPTPTPTPEPTDTPTPTPAPESDDEDADVADASDIDGESGQDDTVSGTTGGDSSTITTIIVLVFVLLLLVGGLGFLGYMFVKKNPQMFKKASDKDDNVKKAIPRKKEKPEKKVKPEKTEKTEQKVPVATQSAERPTVIEDKKPKKRLLTNFKFNGSKNDDNSEPKCYVKFTDLVIGRAGTVNQVEIKEKIVIGQSSDCDFCIESDGSLSPRHCEIVKKGNDLILRDLNTINGTIYNGFRLTGDIILIDGGILEMGRQKFQVSIIRGDNVNG